MRLNINIDFEAHDLTSVVEICKQVRNHPTLLIDIGGGTTDITLARTSEVHYRRFVIKMIHPHCAADPAVRARFLHEARVQAAINDDRLVLFFRSGNDRDVPFIIMPLLKGRTHAEEVNEGERLPFGAVVRIAREIAEGLAAIHAAGIVHLDIKPANVMSPDREEHSVVILDWGLGRSRSAAPAEMNPDQVKKQEPTPTCDVFSLGTLRLRLLACESSSPEQTVENHASTPHDHPRFEEHRPTGESPEKEGRQVPQVFRYAMWGPSGVGKSTLINRLVSIPTTELRPDATDRRASRSDDRIRFVADLRRWLQTPVRVCHEGGPYHVIDGQTRLMDVRRLLDELCPTLAMHRLAWLAPCAQTSMFASCGAGKTASVLAYLLHCADSAVVLDIKGELSRATTECRRRMGHKVVVLDPFGIAGTSDSFNPLDQIAESPFLPVEEYRAIAETLGFRTRDFVPRQWADEGVLVTGQTGSGKTSLLNALSVVIPAREHIVVIEDSCELRLQQPHTLYLVAQPPDPKGRGEATIRDLFVDSLRTRPDRILVGEVRRGEALDLIQSMISENYGSATAGCVNSALLMLNGCWRLRSLMLLGKSVHAAVIASAGQGKSTAFVIPHLLPCGSSCVVIDFKGELYKATAELRRTSGHRIVVLDPFRVVVLEADMLNPLDLIDLAPTSGLDGIRDVAKAIIVRMGEEKKPHWNDAAEMHLAAVIALAIAEFSQEKRKLQSVAEVLASSDKLAMLRSGTGGSPFAGLGEQFRHFVREELGSTLTKTARHIRFLTTPAVVLRMAGGTFDPRELVTRRIAVCLIIPPNHLRTQSRLLRLWITALLRTDNRRWADEGREVHFVLDEAAALGHLEAIDDMFARSRGYGVRMLFVYQNVDQMKNCFPVTIGETFLAKLETLGFFGFNHFDTADYVSEIPGKETVAANWVDSAKPCGHGEESAVLPGQIQYIHPSLLLPPTDDIRDRATPEYIAQFRRLTVDIQKRGVRHPICGTLVEGHMRLVYGETRRLAVLAAGLNAVPAIVLDHRLIEEEIIPEQLLENERRSEFTPLERAAIYQQLMSLSGRSQAEVAQQIQISPALVSKALAVRNSLAVELRPMIVRGVLPCRVAYTISQLQDADDQRDLAEKFANGLLSREELEAEVKTLTHEGRKIAITARHRAARPRLARKERSSSRPVETIPRLLYASDSTSRRRWSGPTRRTSKHRFCAAALST